MQNRYVGDVGDFGKLGLLRFISRSGLRIGVNWYLVPDESHNADGKHTTYLQKKAFKDCDDELLSALGQIVSTKQRAVSSLERAHLTPNALYYSAILYPPNTDGVPSRDEWHQTALQVLEPTDLVFLDPDNGLIVKSVGARSLRSNKYILPEELRDYYRPGHSVFFYNHRSRQAENDYLERFRQLQDDPAFEDARWLGVKFKRGTVRDFFFILQPLHAMALSRLIDSYLESNWRRHSARLAI